MVVGLQKRAPQASTIDLSGLEMISCCVTEFTFYLYIYIHMYLSGISILFQHIHCLLLSVWVWVWVHISASLPLGLWAPERWGPVHLHCKALTSTIDTIRHLISVVLKWQMVSYSSNISVQYVTLLCSRRCGIRMLKEVAAHMSLNLIKDREHSMPSLPPRS